MVKYPIPYTSFPQMNSNSIKINNKFVLSTDLPHSFSFRVVATSKHHFFERPGVQNPILDMNKMENTHLAKRHPAVLRLYFAVDDARVALPLGATINFVMNSNSTTLRYFKQLMKEGGPLRTERAFRQHTRHFRQFTPKIGRFLPQKRNSAEYQNVPNDFTAPIQHALGIPIVATIFTKRFEQNPNSVWQRIRRLH